MFEIASFAARQYNLWREHVGISAGAGHCALWVFKSVPTAINATDKLSDMSNESSSTQISSWVTTVDSVFPHHANPLGTLFGGRVLELMDVNASIACNRFCRLPVVTASTEPVDFRNPIHVGEIIELSSRVTWTGRTSMIVRSEVFGENPLTGERRLCTIGHMNFVAIGDNGKPTAVPKLRVESELEQAHWNIGKSVREAILLRRSQQGSGVGD